MRTRTTNRPLGTDAAADFHNQQFDRAQQETQVFNSTTVKAHRTTRGIRLSAAPGVFQQPAAGIHWAEAGRIYDKENSYLADEIVWIEATNSIVTAGAIDADTGTLLYASPGLWLCIKSTSPSAGPKYNVPREPWPVSDDPTSDSNYWILLRGPITCT